MMFVQSLFHNLRNALRKSFLFFLYLARWHHFVLNTFRIITALKYANQTAQIGAGILKTPAFKRNDLAYFVSENWVVDFVAMWRHSVL